MLPLCHSPAHRGSALCPALAVPEGTCHPPVLQHWALHRLPGCWDGVGAASSPEQLPGELVGWQELGAVPPH